MSGPFLGVTYASCPQPLGLPWTLTHRVYLTILFTQFGLLEMRFCQ